MVVAPNPQGNRPQSVIMSHYQIFYKALDIDGPIPYIKG